MASRYWPTRDTNLAKRFNDELVGNLKDGTEGIIGQDVILYRVSLYDTTTKMYGEAGEGKTYESGIKLSCIIEAEDFNWESNEFGPDAGQNITIHFQRDMLIDVSFRPDIGDVISWNLGYFEINGTNENQLVAGDFNKNWTISCTANLTRISLLNIEQTRAF